MIAECPICYERFSADLRLASLLCGHVCCADCLDTWLGNLDEYTCPICRFNPEDDTKDSFDASGCHPVYLKFGECSTSQTSSPVRPQASKSRSGANIPSLVRQMDGVQRRVVNLTSQAGFPDAVELRATVSGIQLLGDGVRTNLPPEAQELAQHLLQKITFLTSYLDTRYSSTLANLETERTARVRLAADLDAMSERKREKDRLIREQAIKIARMTTQIKASEEAHRNFTEHLDRMMKTLEADNSRLKKRETENNVKIADLLKADTDMKNTVLHLKRKLTSKEKGHSDLQQQLENQKEELTKMSADNVELKRKLRAASSSGPPSVSTGSLTMKNLAVHTARHAVAIEDLDDEPLIIESSPKPLEKKALPVGPLLLDRSMFQPENASRMPPNPSGQKAPKAKVPGKRKAEDNPLAFLHTSSLLATGPKRSRRLP
ncbi:hypothetical protein FRB94_010545 [Tulasnella sp. JGI-2019a]|nr:hypothetical protein FRB94_010545 [Tulasnella sp. JGI-2019a]KAG9017903.1 hypothetical protein FRB93_004714 [Tulasnella sp. JGI-2019a]KAG9039074.1 hypothetical protein FRB95_012785 [Tulasnella sp. JGI-2019a]